MSGGKAANHQPAQEVTILLMLLHLLVHMTVRCGTPLNDFATRYTAAMQGFMRALSDLFVKIDFLEGRVHA
jgi:hypothetical protein